MQIQAVNPNFTPQMEDHTLENDMELKICSPYYPHISAYDISAYDILTPQTKPLRSRGLIELNRY